MIQDQQSTQESSSQVTIKSTTAKVKTLKIMTSILMRGDTYVIDKKIIQSFKIQDYIYIQKHLTKIFRFFSALQTQMRENNYREIFNQMSIIEFERHKVIYYEGDVGRIMYFVLSGEVKLLITEEDNTGFQKNIKNDDQFTRFHKNNFSGTVVSQELKKGDHFGDLSLFHRIPRIETAVCSKPTQCATLSYETYQDLIGMVVKQQIDKEMLFLGAMRPFLEWKPLPLCILLQRSHEQEYKSQAVIYREGSENQREVSLCRNLINPHSDKIFTQKLLNIAHQGYFGAAQLVEQFKEKRRNEEPATNFKIIRDHSVIAVNTTIINEIKFETYCQIARNYQRKQFENFISVAHNPTLDQRTKEFQCAAEASRRIETLKQDKVNFINISQLALEFMEAEPEDPIRQFRVQTQREQNPTPPQTSRMKRLNGSLACKVILELEKSSTELRGKNKYLTSIQNIFKILISYSFIQQSSQVLLTGSDQQITSQDNLTEFKIDVLKKFSFAIPFRENPYSNPLRTVRNKRIQSSNIKHTLQDEITHVKSERNFLSEKNNKFCNIDVMKIFKISKQDNIRLLRKLQNRCKIIVSTEDSKKSNVHTNRDSNIHTSRDKIINTNRDRRQQNQINYTANYYSYRSPCRISSYQSQSRKSEVNIQKSSPSLFLETSQIKQFIPITRKQIILSSPKIFFHDHLRDSYNFVNKKNFKELCLAAVKKKHN